LELQNLQKQNPISINLATNDILFYNIFLKNLQAKLSILTFLMMPENPNSFTKNPETIKNVPRKRKRRNKRNGNPEIKQNNSAIREAILKIGLVLANSFSDYYNKILIKN
jgi:hypothetical protein